MPIQTPIPSLDRDGFCILDDLFDADHLHRLRALADGVEEEVRVWMPDACPPDLLALCRSPCIAAALRQRLGAAVWFLSVKAVSKGRGECRPSPWHQDRPYWGGDEAKWSLWIACDEARVDNGCLRVLPGAHRGRLEHARGGDPRRFGNRLDPSGIDESAAIDVPLRAGQALLFHDLLPHASYAGRPGRLRRSIIATYRCCAHEPEDFWSGGMAMEDAS